MKRQEMNKIKNGTFWVPGKKTENVTMSSLHLLHDVGGYLQSQGYSGYVGSPRKGRVMGIQQGLKKKYKAVLRAPLS